MLTVGVTGSSGSGKGYICSRFKELGISSLDTDGVTHIIYKKGHDCYSELVLEFGSEILDDNGEIDRAKLFSATFYSAEKYSFLTETAYKHVLIYAKKWLAEQQMKGCEVAIIDAPMLFESGADKMCDIIIGVICDEDTQITRLLARDGITREKAIARIEKQKSKEFLCQNCDIIIDNSIENADNIESIIKEVSEMLFSTSKFKSI